VRLASQTAGPEMSTSILIVCIPYHAQNAQSLILAVTVSYVWNVYRKTHLMVLEIMYKCRQRLELVVTKSAEQMHSQRIAEAIAASIPYHLTADAHKYLQQVRAGSKNIVLGPLVGGLFMLHSLHMAGRCSAVSQELRDYMSSQLMWIGKMMGIGQATLFGQASVSNESSCITY
jgi:hypothetical protein